jgi:hypothetical protein
MMSVKAKTTIAIVWSVALAVVVVDAVGLWTISNDSPGCRLRLAAQLSAAPSSW